MYEKPVRFFIPPRICYKLILGGDQRATLEFGVNHLERNQVSVSAYYQFLPAPVASTGRHYRTVRASIFKSNLFSLKAKFANAKAGECI